MQLAADVGLAVKVVQGGFCALKILQRSQVRKIVLLARLVLVGVRGDRLVGATGVI